MKLVSLAGHIGINKKANSHFEIGFQIIHLDWLILVYQWCYFRVDVLQNNTNTPCRQIHVSFDVFPSISLDYCYQFVPIPSLYGANN
jgi:hypothetical protein